MKTRYWYWIWKTFLGPSRLRKKFVRVFILAGIIPLILMGAVSAYLVNLTHSIDVQALEKNIARQVSVEIKKIVDETIEIIELRVAFPEFAPISFSQQDFILEGILKDKESLNELSFICHTPKQCSLGRETKRWLRSRAGIIESNNLRDKATSPDFLTAKAGKTYIGQVNFREKSPIISISAPVYNKNSEIIAVLAGEMNLNLIQSVVSVTKLGDGGYVYLTDAQGKIIAHREAKLVSQDAALMPPVSIILGRQTDNSGTVYENFDEVSVSGAGNLIEELGWIVVAEWPRDETQARIRTIFIQIAIFSFITLVVIAVIASWVAFRLIQPIAQLSEGTSVIGGGNFDYRVDIKTGDELEDLGKNLNKMALNLKGLEQVRELKLRTELLSKSLAKEKELSKLKDQFIRTISHQLNTPLSVIKWALSELETNKTDPGKVKQIAFTISKSQQDIVSIVNDLVTLSEVGFKYERTRAQPTDIVKLINKIIESFSEAITIKKLKINFRAEARDPVANVNEFMIAKAIENLIDNAIGYSNDGGRVEIGLTGDNRELTLKISDRGIGIPKEDQISIFEQFFRARNAIAKKNVGTGLGLYIAKNIAEGHRGKIWFNSEENKGSTFYMTIPR